MDDSSTTLGIHWSFGFSKDCANGVNNLTTPDRNAIFFLNSHSGVIYDYEKRSQLILQGHTHVITTCAISQDKKWIVTADAGPESILVIWDSQTGAPVKTFFSPHTMGTCAVDISPDALYVSTLSHPVEGEVQEVAVWAWTTDSDQALLRTTGISGEIESFISFDPSNNFDLVTTGPKSVSFWNWTEYRIEGYVGKVSKSDLGYFSGSFTQSMFLPDSGGNAITATDEGYTILWETTFSKALIGASDDKNLLSAAKVVKLMECGINVVKAVNGYLALACADGCVRFYDFSLRLEAWFEDFAAGPITSLSFSIQVCPYPEGEGGAPGLQFWVPDFMIGTSDAFIVGVESSCFGEVRSENRRGTLLMQGFPDEVQSVNCHPFRPLLALACSNSSLQIWDYELKLLMNLREFNFNGASQNNVGKKKTGTLKPQCFQYEPSQGQVLAVGFQTGLISFLDVDTLSDVASFSTTQDAIVDIVFSPSGQFMAAHDAMKRVLIWSKGAPDLNDEIGTEVSKDKQQSYTFIGRAIAHTSRIVGLVFGNREGTEVLISVGEDRKAIEYDLKESSVENGVVIIDTPTRLELVPRPTAVCWHPHCGDDNEDRFIIANEDFKFKEFNSESKQCRNTTLTPAFGGPLTTIIPLPVDASQDGEKYYAYSTAENVVGVGCLPLTGDPKNVMGLVAHPGSITGMTISYCGQYMFSTGGKDLSANMWFIDTQKLPRGADQVTVQNNFLELLEGGSGGELHNDIIDYFYYCQLRTQGEDSMDDRSITGKIPVGEIPHLVRAIGFYPSEEDIANMVNEVRYKHFMIDGAMEDHIGLNDFIRLYINHRPIIPLTTASIEAALEVIKENAGVRADSIDWKSLKNILITEGEAFSDVELTSCLQALTGEADKDDDHRLNAGIFSDHILGFEDFSDQP